MSEIEVIVFDFDGTLFDLAAKWDNLTDVNREEIEFMAIGNRKLNNHIVQLIKSLQEKYSIAILSKNLTATIMEVLTRSGVEDVLVVGRDYGGRVKPHPEGLKNIAAIHGTNNLLMVGNSQEDVDVAKAFGCPSMIVANVNQKKVPVGADHYVKEIFP